MYPQKKENIMTAARQLERKGRQEGKQKGKQEGRQEVARNMLVKLHLDLDTVQKATELTEEELQEILKEGSIISRSK